MKRIFGPEGLLARVLPGYEHRTGQQAMADAVLATLEMGGVLVVEAGTGIGKTLAYLVPLLSAGVKGLVSTGTKNLQEQIIRRDLPLLSRLAGQDLRLVLMKGRRNYLCRRRFKRWRTQPTFRQLDEAKVFDELLGWAGRTKTGDLAEFEAVPETAQVWNDLTVGSESCLGSKCPDFEDCFVLKIRRAAAGADVVVVNHHLLFADLAVRQAGFGEVLPRAGAVILDEAHLVAQTAVRFFGVNLTGRMIEDFSRDLTRDLAGAKRSVRRIIPELGRLEQSAQAWLGPLLAIEGSRSLSAELKDKKFLERAARVADLLTVVSGRIKDVGEAEVETDNLVRRATDLADVVRRVVDDGADDLVRWVEVKGRHVTLHASPVDVGEYLAEALYANVRSVVFTSATLSVAGRLDYAQADLGLTGAADGLIVPSPFDYQRQTLLYVPSDLPLPGAETFIDAAADRLMELLTATRGRAFVLCTSFRNMNAFHQKLEGRLEYPCLVQGQAPRTVLLDRFRQTPGAILFATMSFWQGVDVPGPALSAVIVDRLPFDPPDEPLVAAKIARLRGNGGDPFFEFQVPTAVLQLKQGLGRLIRSRSDRGLLAVLDVRLIKKGYGRLFIKSLPDSPLTHDLGAVREFFSPDYS
ncbi:MAG: ATP-dependent DNA helicase [Proteobacteria bacterium]|nr:ATP-dependent DNA helicase [Pseudomonadota bacterium]